ncbi:alpha/beta hydrolase [Aeromonas allosaccharophila]|uniref:alpha/beta hydrolase n=1 Tax=Aeromonas allosaccharophila TaxID=656 RepID=UPI0009E7CC28|nr:alpha/beta hydrolase [Aeromonas allosaccharophila]
MNLTKVKDILSEKLPCGFLTLSSSSYYTSSVHGDTLKIKTNNKTFNIPLDSFYELLADVMAKRSFEIKEYKYNYKNVAYSLPIIKEIITKEYGSIYNYTPPKGGWRKEKPIDKDYYESSVASSSRTIPSIDIISDSVMRLSLKDEAPVENVLVDVHYATTRVPAGNDIIFSDSKDTKTHYGYATVSIPKNEHRSGNVERPLEIFKIKFRENKNKHFTIETGKSLSETDFFSEVKDKSNSKSLMIFIHGYNVSFKDAIFKSAQIKYDLNYEHPILLFSWPSNAKLRSYVSDKESAQYSSSSLRELLYKISTLGIEDIMVIGHSMGTYCLAESLNSFEPECTSFNSLVLAAADIQKNEFINVYSKKIKSIFEMVSLYVSSSDKALIASNLINESERVGDASRDVIVVDGIDSIDMSNLDKNTFSLGHSYISESNRVLDDLHNFLLNKIPAKMRRLKHLTNKDDMGYWSLHN